MISRKKISRMKIALGALYEKNACAAFVGMINALNP
jgi:hypothetical protein